MNYDLTKRLFIALTFDDEMAAFLTELQRRLWQAGIDGRYTHKEHLHQTLVFIGETTWLGAAQRVIESVKQPAFTLETTKLGLFSQFHGEILWLGTTPVPPLLALVGELSEKLQAVGFQLEKRKYHPHITLARRARLHDVDIESLTPPPIQFEVKGFSLIESDLSSGEPVYKELAWESTIAAE